MSESVRSSIYSVGPISMSGVDNETFSLEMEDRVSDTITPTIKLNRRSKFTKSVSIDVDDVFVYPPTEFNPSAVSVQNAYKRYGNFQILDNLNMTVKQGNIYSILGASGCGKTTLLSCLVGLKKLDSGLLEVLGARPGSKESGVPGKRVGFMPQEIALFGEFSIFESLYFYGRIYSMTNSQIEENITFLIDFLNLPKGDRVVKNLSGGQQRRVSLACSMIHDPELLLLDEPTVGLDALLRKSIWEHLVKLVSTGRTTVIITTHYIEEARLSNTIGLMRNGKLLVEDSPSNLLKTYKTNLLDDIVMELCLKDSKAETEISFPTEDGQKAESYTKLEDSLELSNWQNNPSINGLQLGDEDAVKWRNFHRASAFSDSAKSGRRERLEDSWNRLVTLSIKNFLTSIRNLLFLAFILFCPALQVIVVCLAIGGDPKGLDFGILNHELKEGESCWKNYNKNETIFENRTMEVKGCPLNDNFTGLMSCHFLSFIDPEYINLKMYEYETDAIKDVEDSKVWGLLTFPQNYTKSVKERGLFGVHAESDSVYGSFIGIQMDFSNKQIGTQIAKNFYIALHDMMKNMSMECGIDPINLESPLIYKKPIYGDEEMSFQEYVAPSVLLGIIFFFPVTSSGLNYISEKRLGTLNRSIVAGVTNAEFMLAYSGVQLVILFIQASLAFAFLVFVFGIEINGPFCWAYGLALLVGFAGISVGFILSAICSQEVQAVLLAMGMFVPNLMLAGMIWPLSGMPQLLQYVAYILPCTLACESMRSIVSRGVGISHPKVWPGFISTILWIIFYWTLLMIVNRIKSRK